MPYEITISGIDTTFNKCIDWVACKVDTPSTSNAKSNYVGNYINISGFIGTDEVTIDLYKWAILPVNDSNVFRNVQLTVKDANDNVIEKISFPNAFVEFYRESYTRDKGLGKFDLQLKQKIDKNMDIKVSDASTEEKIKSVAESKILDSVLGNTPKSGILDTGAGKITVDDDVLEHSNIGDFTEHPNPRKKVIQNMRNGGHGQDGMDYLDQIGFDYNVEKTHPNGVKTGSIFRHKNDMKRNGGQSWFPDDWTKEDIRMAGEHIANLDPSQTLVSKNGAIHGIFSHKGVDIEVGIYKDPSTRKPTTIFPDINQSHLYNK